MESGIKERYGVTVTIIERADQRILAPTRDEFLLPGDKLFLIGTDDALTRARALIEAQPQQDMPPLSESFGLSSITLLPSDRFVNKTIRECGIRESIDGLIVGLERNGNRYLSPDSSMMLLPRDLIWVVGDRMLIKSLRSPGSN